MKTAFIAAALVGIGLLSFLFSGAIASTTGQDLIVSGSDKDLPYRISKLEAKIATLEERFKELESRSRVLTIPGPQVPPGTQLPPGSKPFDFNVMKFWMVPVNTK